MKQLVNWYIKYLRKTDEDSDNEFRSIFSSSVTIEEKAKLLLIGDHQWYLIPFHKDELQSMLSMLCARKPWEQNILATSFEELFQECKTQLNYNCIKQLTIYDVALRMAILFNRKDLFPSQYIYLHATPMIAYRWLYKHHLVNVKVSGSLASIDICNLNGVFGSLNAREIENLLCHLEKAIKRLKENKQHLSKDKREIELDSIVNKLKMK